MKKITASILAALVVMSMATGCKDKNTTTTDVRTSATTVAETKQDDPSGPSDPDIPDRPSDPQQRTTNGIKMSETDIPSGYYDFAAQLTSYCAANGGDDNIMISPASAFLAMSMVEQATEGQTNQEIINALLNGSTDEEFLEFSKLYSAYLEEDELQIANSFWMCEDYTGNRFLPDYIDVLTNDYNADIGSIKFDTEGEQTVNNWVSDHTHGKINDLIAPGDLSDLDQGVGVLVNAIAFDGSWDVAYENVIDQTFTDSNGNTSDVPMLISTEDIYIEGAGATGFVKEYEGGKFAFMAMLPDDTEMNGNEFLADLTAEEYMELWNSRSYTDVDTKMPKFESEYSTSLIDAFSSMGINIAFEGSTEFTRMLEAPDLIKIAKAKQKTHIKVDEKGTQAEAATAIIVAVEGACEITESHQVFCDRPFAYAIVDTSTGLPIFIGSVNAA